MLALTLVLGASACSSDDNADPPDTTVAPTAAPTSATATTTTTTEPKSEEDEVAEAYLESERVFYEIAQDPDPDDPRLKELYVEPNLSYVRGVFRDTRKAGLFVEFIDGPPKPQVLDVTLDGRTATVQSCVVDDSQQVEKSSGDVVDDEVVTRKHLISLSKVGEHWFSQSGEVLESWPDGKGCDR